MSRWLLKNYLGAALCLAIIANSFPKSALAKEDSADLEADALLRRLQNLQSIVLNSSKSLTLDEAIALGIKNNPELVSAFRTIQQYEWQLVAAQRRWYPNLRFANGSPFVGYTAQTFVQRLYRPQSFTSDLAATATEEGSLSSLPESSQVTTTTSPQITTYSSNATFQPGLSFSWDAIDPTRQPSINAASEALREQKLLFIVSARNLILEIQTAYYALQSTRQLIDDFQEIYDINRRQLDFIQAQYGILMVSVQDLAQTETQLYTQLNSLINYTQSFLSEAAVLSRSLGMKSDELAIPSEKARLYPEWKLSLSDTITRAIEMREEILSSLAAAQQAKWRGLAAIRAYLPKISLIGSGNLSYQSGVLSGQPGLNTSDYLAETRRWDTNVGLGFSWLMFDGGVQAAQSQSAYSLEAKNKSVAELNKLKAVEQVRSSYGKYRSADIAVHSARRAYKSAQLAQEAALARFDVGVTSITSLVQTIQQLGQSSTQLSLAIKSYNSAVAELYRYSATWPGETDQLVNEQERRLR